MTVLVETPVAFADVEAVPVAVRAVFASTLVAVGKRALEELGASPARVEAWCETVLLAPEDVLLLSAVVGEFSFFVPCSLFSDVGVEALEWVDDLGEDGSSWVMVNAFGLLMRLNYSASEASDV